MTLSGQITGSRPSGRDVQGRPRLKQRERNSHHVSTLLWERSSLLVVNIHAIRHIVYSADTYHRAYAIRPYAPLTTNHYVWDGGKKRQQCVALGGRRALCRDRGLERHVMSFKHIARIGQEAHPVGESA